MKIEDKSALKQVLKRYTDSLFQRYYITNPPQIYKSDNVDMGYSKSEKSNRQSIRFGFKTTQPTETDLEMLIKVFVETETNKYD
tara:strand:+ start:273 stop:524 length:252 start_codon:yes stop_codon:yes gene_type:complete